MPEPQVLLTGVAFGESPRWHEDRLWFSDWMAQEVVAVDVKGDSEVVTQVRSFPFCIDFLPDGRMLTVSSDEQKVLRREPDGSMVTHADLTGHSAFAWNEIVVDARGNAYINNIGFDFPEGEFAPGTIVLVTPDGAVSPVAGDVAFPNGMAITPDNATLIVAESYGNRLTAFDIAPDGTLSNRRVWADLGDGYPDGICLDAEGAVWYADVPNKRCVRVREGGEITHQVTLDRGCFSCALGGEDRNTLFIVAQEYGESMGEARTGQVVTVEAPVPAAR